MAKTWITDGRSIARKVFDPKSCSTKQIGDSGAKRECPKCHYWIDNSDVSYEWPGLPAGVKFDPSDVELLDHLAAKCGVRNAEPHIFIDDFIPTLKEDRGICYTHPENLPGAKKDGSCIHFFHKTANAYASGLRKRRKIQSDQPEEKVRWHKTGKTKPVVDMSGVQKGCKKILVLYRCSKKGSKPLKSNWVMHQYHLGMEEDEKESEYVVSKICYQQQKEIEKEDNVVVHEEPLMAMNPIGPNTPTPNPPRPGSAGLRDDAIYQDLKPIDEASGLAYNLQPEEDVKYNPIVAGESQAVDPHPDDFEEPLLCKELLESCTSLTNGYVKGINYVTDGSLVGGCYGLSELENLDFDTPPDLSLADLQFCSQDSISKWLDSW